MQTFLPYSSFQRSAACLDNRRLGKQRVETKQILIALNCPVGDSPGRWDSSWRNHPAVKMWYGYCRALTHYGIEICLEWRRRGFRDGLLEQFTQLDKRLAAGGVIGVVYTLKEMNGYWPRSEYAMPEWVGREDFHASHRSNLLRKDSEWYGQFGWKEPSDLPYVWPARI